MTHPRTDRRPVRRMGAQARAAQRAARTAKEQLTLVASRPGEAQREVARLTPPRKAKKTA